MLDVDLHRAANHRTPATRMALVHAKHHLPHTPRRLDPQQPLERLGTLHPASLRPIGSLSRSSMPTQQPEDPYVRLAGLISVMSFVASYQPALFVAAVEKLYGGTPKKKTRERANGDNETAEGS